MVKVSVVIPTYNRRELLRKALQSVYGQTFRDFEVIVVDDCSPDGTSEDFATPVPGTTLISLPHSGHPSVARNAGIAQAKGEYIAFLDSDDAWAPTKLERQVGLLENDPSIALVSSNATVVRPGSNEERPFHPSGMNVPASAAERLLKSNYIITSTVVVRRAALDSVGGFSEDPLVRGMEDYDLWLRLSLRHRFAYIDATLASYLDQDTSIRSEISRVRYWEGMLRVYGGLADGNQLSEGTRRALADARFEAAFMLGLSQARAGRRSAALRTFAGSLVGSPVRFARRLGYELIA